MIVIRIPMYSHEGSGFEADYPDSPPDLENALRLAKKLAKSYRWARVVDRSPHGREEELWTSTMKNGEVVTRGGLPCKVCCMNIPKTGNTCEACLAEYGTVACEEFSNEPTDVPSAAIESEEEAVSRDENAREQEGM